jgi:hypothetical protein
VTALLGGAPKADDSGSRPAICPRFLPVWDIAGLGSHRPQGDRRLPPRSISLHHEAERPGGAASGAARYRPVLWSGRTADAMLDTQ